MFFPGSRYLAIGTYAVTMPDGRTVQATRLPRSQAGGLLGYYRRGETDRLDHIASRYLGDATRFWHICDANGAMVPDALAARPLIGVPIDATGTS